MKLALPEQILLKNSDGKGVKSLAVEESFHRACDFTIVAVVLRSALDVERQRGDAVSDGGRRVVDPQPPDDSLVIVFAGMDEGGGNAIDQIPVTGRLGCPARRSDTDIAPCSIA